MSRTLLEILENIRKRVRKVSPDMPEEDFNALTARMATVEHKYDQAPERLSTFPPDVERRERDRRKSSDGPARE